MKIIKVSTELEMSVHEFPEGTMREQNKALYDLIGNGCDIVEHVMPKRLYTELKMPSTPVKEPAFSWMLLWIACLKKPVRETARRGFEVQRMQEAVP